jgi:poly-gamma-glutamate synthesis protein (capsule biosynthesis protein)
MNEQSLDPSIRIAAVGDLMLGDSAICPGFGFAGRYRNQSDRDGFERLAQVLGPADIAFGNLECTLSNNGHNPDLYESTHMRGRPEYADALRLAGFTILSLANNHANQHGAVAFEDTVAMLRAAGIECCGLRGTGVWTSHPVLLTAKSKRVGFLAYCLRPRQYSNDVPPYAEGTPEQICDDIVRLRNEADIVVVSIHWGEEFVDVPSEEETAIARTLIDAGATAVLGHHPHVPRPIEQYHGGIIAYSLGNFISDMVWQDRLRKGILLKIDAGADATAVAEPYYIADDFMPFPAEDSADWAVVVERTRTLPQAAYKEQVARTVGEQRGASYLFALRNLHRFRLPMLLQLVRRTIANKLLGILRSA